MQVPLSAAAPYDRVREGPGTWCRGCHRYEAQVDSVAIAEGFASDVLRPSPLDDVALSYVANEASICDGSAEPERCEMLNSLFAHDPIEPRDFSSDARTIYDY